MSFPIGQIQRPNLLSHNAGVIMVTNLLAQIGGQRRFSALVTRIISTDVTLVANTRYQIFAVLVGGAVQLRISTNENSVGPTGFTAWDLIGAFYANGVTGNIAFGSFVNIIGRPETDMMPYTPVMNWVSNVNTPTGSWRRDGDKHNQNVFFSIVGPMSGVSVSISPPTGLLWDTTKINTGAAYQGTCGVWGAVRAGVTVQSGVMGLVSNNATNWLVNNVNAYVGNTNPNSWTNGDVFSCDFSAPIAGWSNKQLKDL